MLYPIPSSLSIQDVDEIIRTEFLGQNNYSNIPSLPVHPYSNEPYVEIIEQPAFASFRYRYGSEIKGKSVGSILGVHDSAEVRTYPTIKVMNYQGPYAVVVSCVTKDGPPYRPHPYKLFGKKNCERGFCSMIVNNPNMTCSFTNLGIQCVKRSDIEESLRIREAYKIDPFGTGFNHSGSIDLHFLRLCFQVFIRGPDNSCSLPLQPVVSDPIFNQKKMSFLKIVKISLYSAPVSGGTDVILLCDPVDKDDIQIWFYEKQGTNIVWESQAIFQSSDVYRKLAISFKTPRYHNENIQHSVPVFVELRKPSTNQRGEARPFLFLSMEKDPNGLARKKFKAHQKIDRYFQRGVLPGFTTREIQMPIAVPRTMRKSSNQGVNDESNTEHQMSISVPSLLKPPSHQMVNTESSTEHQMSTSVPSTFIHPSHQVLNAESAIENQMSTSVPSTLRQPSHQMVNAESATGNKSMLVTKTNEFYPQPSTSFEYCRSPVLTAMPVPAVGPSTSPRLTPIHLPDYAASPGVHSQVSVTSPIESLTSPITPEPCTSFEYSISSLLKTVPVPVIGQSTSRLAHAHLPDLTASPGAYSQASATQPLEALSSSIIQQMMQQSSKPVNTEIQSTEEMAIIEKLDSLDLNLADINMTLSASLFDSATSITDVIYQEASSSAYK